jgi:hypothetical protein
VAQAIGQTFLMAREPEHYDCSTDIVPKIAASSATVGQVARS